MSEDVVKRFEGLFRRFDKISRFGTKYNCYPHKELGKILDELKELRESVPDIQNPKDYDELIKSELKKRIGGEIFSLEHRLSGKCYDFDTVISIYGIPKPDITELRGWLDNNRKKTIESIERLFETEDVQNYELFLPADIPGVKRQAEEFATVHIQKYHKRLGKLLQDLTKVGEFLRDINAVPTTEARSYFYPLTNTLAIGIPAICFTTEDGDLHIRERELITLYGHEGMGHALNQVITNTAKIPYFLTKQSGLTVATMESVAQFYQKVIFEDLKASPETQKELGIQNEFGRIYQEAKDIRKLTEYSLKLSQYAITVLADKNLGDPNDPDVMKKKAGLISEVTIDPAYPSQLVEQQRYNFDSKGNLNVQLLSELRYCAQPVKRVLEEFAKLGIVYEGDGRSKIDKTLLTGYWTPIGFVDNAKIRAKEK